MADTTAPLKSYEFKPGQHSHNVARWRPEPGASSERPLIRRLRLVLLLIGLAGLGYYGYTLANQYLYQRYENWAFDQAIVGHGSPTFWDYLRNATPLQSVLGTRTEESSRTPPENEAKSPPPNSPIPVEQPPTGTVLGRLEIGRLRISAIVRQGADAKTLGVAVGHLESTALPGQAGNFAIAAHRDTLFRGLKDVQKGDLVTFQSETGTYMYRVLATKIVKPTDVSVLQANGGGLIAGVTPKDKLLTMITCYPFYYVGSAPKRFIVEGELVPNG